MNPGTFDLLREAEVGATCTWLGALCQWCELEEPYCLKVKPRWDTLYMEKECEA